MMCAQQAGAGADFSGWLVLVYRVPADPSSNRVSVWRDLKRIGALYLQQCAIVLPRREDLKGAVAGVREKIVKLGGSSNLFEVPELAADEEEALVAGFRELTAKQYAEIVEECETKFVKEVEFERFRKNYSFAEAEEIEQDLDKIRRWYSRVRERDWFEAHGRDQVDAWLARCEELLDGFYADVHALGSRHASSPDAAEIEHEVPRLAGVPSPEPQAAPPEVVRPRPSVREREGGNG